MRTHRTELARLLRTDERVQEAHVRYKAPGSAQLTAEIAALRWALELMDAQIAAQEGERLD